MRNEEQYSTLDVTFTMQKVMSLLALLTPPSLDATATKIRLAVDGSASLHITSRKRYCKQ